MPIKSIGQLNANKHCLLTNPADDYRTVMRAGLDYMRRDHMFERICRQHGEDHAFNIVERAAILQEDAGMNRMDAEENAILDNCK